jgi:hypothetical protein
LHPGNVWRFGPCLSEHAKRSVEPDQLRAGHDSAICDQLVSGPAADIQDGQDVRGLTLADEGQEFRISGLRPIWLRVIETGDLIVVYAE